MLTQMNMKEGLNIFGDKANEAIMKELRQLHNKKSLFPMKKENMFYDKWKRVLRYLMFLKEKRWKLVVVLMVGLNESILCVT